MREAMRAEETRMSRRGIRSTATAAIVAIGLALGGAAEAAQGNAVIDSKQDGAVVLGGASYRVGDATVIEDENGNKLRFAEVPSIADGASQDAAAVYFEASDEESPMLQLLRLTGAVPR
jgi:hypothetical protein